jgi:hypothetical protein
MSPPAVARLTEGRGSFLKKAAQKLLCAGSWALSATTPVAQINKVFLLFLVHKKKSFLPSSATLTLAE